MMPFIDWTFRNCDRCCILLDWTLQYIDRDRARRMLRAEPHHHERCPVPALMADRTVARRHS